MNQTNVQIVPILLLLLPLMFVGCDNGSPIKESSEQSDFFEEQLVEEQLEENDISHAAQQLMDILDSQSQVVDDVIFAKDMGDKAAMRASFKEFVELSNQYQEEFDAYVDELSYKEAREISNRYRAITKRLPSLR